MGRCTHSSSGVRIVVSTSAPASRRSTSAASIAAGPAAADDDLESLLVLRHEHLLVRSWMRSARQATALAQ